MCFSLLGWKKGLNNYTRLNFHVKQAEVAGRPEPLRLCCAWLGAAGAWHGVGSRYRWCLTQCPDELVSPGCCHGA